MAGPASSSLPDDETSLKGTRHWPHAPPHRLSAAGVYFVTARTVDRQRFFYSPERLDFVLDHLLKLAARYGWKLEAWAVLVNHYHFVAHAPEGDAASLRPWLRHLHADLTRQVNRWDGVEGRRIWQNYRESHLTYQHSYLGRLNYTHTNAVHHRLAGRARDYPWCSAAALEDTCTGAWVQTLYSFRYEQIATADDDDEVLGRWRMQMAAEFGVVGEVRPLSSASLPTFALRATEGTPGRKR